MRPLRTTLGWWVATGSLLLGDSAWAAKPVVELEPSTPWNMDYAKDSCLLIRAFGEGKQRIILRFERTAPSTVFSLSMIGAPLRTSSNLSEVTVTFGPQGRPDKRERAPSGLAGDKEKLPLVIIEATSILGPKPTSVLGSIAISPEAEQAVDNLLIDHKSSKSAYLLKLGPMGEPMKAMRACTDELLGHWGLDPAVQRTVRSLPEPLSSPGGWLRSADYPKESLASGKSAVIRFRLTVSAAGKATGCAIQSGTRSPEFEKTTCAMLVKRANFKPASDQSGNPVASYFTSTVTWIVN
ncbi:MAG: energy transducer TonB [Novosphingobium sp.]|nr:energy transducer TonB [Novosphingobium sp.]